MVKKDSSKSKGKQKGATKRYLVKDIDPATWAELRIRAIREGRTVREVFEKLIDYYTKKGLD